jgi:pimeloyl-ACP methyl ester carboxylesterase
MISIDAWRARGRFIETPDGRVWMMDTGGAGETVLVLHGFPTSSWDFAEVIDLLAQRRRVVAFDFLGFGLSDKPPEFGYSLFEQADVAIQVARAAGLERAHLFSHDMGTSVVTELLARDERRMLPFGIQSFVLMNGSVHQEMASLTLGQRLLKSPLGGAFAKVSSRAVFIAQMKRVFGRPVAEEDIEGMWDLLAREDGALRLPQIIRYTTERALYRRRWIGALERTRIRALVAWGRRDPVALFAIAEQLQREIATATLEVWDDLGHYPQVEDPARVARTIGGFLDGE